MKSIDTETCYSPYLEQESIPSCIARRQTPVYCIVQVAHRLLRWLSPSCSLPPKLFSMMIFPFKVDSSIILLLVCKELKIDRKHSHTPWYHHTTDAASSNAKQTNWLLHSIFRGKHGTCLATGQTTVMLQEFDNPCAWLWFAIIGVVAAFPLQLSRICYKEFFHPFPSTQIFAFACWRKEKNTLPIQ